MIYVQYISSIGCFETLFNSTIYGQISQLREILLHKAERRRWHHWLNNYQWKCRMHWSSCIHQSACLTDSFGKEIISLFGLGIVALGFKFRLEILGKKSFKQLEVAFQDIRNDLKYKHRFAVYSQKTRWKAKFTMIIFALM